MVEGIYAGEGAGVGEEGPVGATGMAYYPDDQTTPGPTGPQSFTLGVQGPGWSTSPIPANIEKLELKSGDILIIHYPEALDHSALVDVLHSLKRVNERLKDRGINLTDIVLFKEGVKISVLSPKDEEEPPPSAYRRIEL
jgi:hypothetical protein